MIRKIQGNEYLKRYDNMTAQERKEYEDRVGKWLSDNSHVLTEKCDVFEASVQNVLQMSTVWNDQECAAFEEGVLLLSALTHSADTWLPDMLYVKSVKRVVRRMFEALWSVGEGNETSRQNREAQDNEAKEESAEGAEKATQAVAPFQENKGLCAVGGRNTNGEGKAIDDSAISHQPSAIVPVRPKHIDQYVHLLPQKTQEKAATVKGLLRDLDVARENARRLMDANEQGDKIAQWATAAQKIDKKVKAIYKELDAEWKKLVESGRVVVDDLGNARVMDDVRGKMEDDSASSHQPSDITSEQKARRRELRKWLIDTRRGNGSTRDTHIEKWKSNFKEYLTLEGDAAYQDEKIIEAAKHYEIELDNKIAEHSHTKTS